MRLISFLGKSKPNRSFKQAITDIIGYSSKLHFLRVFTIDLEKVDKDGQKINHERLEFQATLYWAQLLETIFSQMPNADEGVLPKCGPRLFGVNF